MGNPWIGVTHGKSMGNPWIYQIPSFFAMSHSPLVEFKRFSWFFSEENGPWGFLNWASRLAQNCFAPPARWGSLNFNQGATPSLASLLPCFPVPVRPKYDNWQYIFHMWRKNHIWTLGHQQLGLTIYVHHILMVFNTFRPQKMPTKSPLEFSHMISPLHEMISDIH